MQAQQQFVAQSIGAGGPTRVAVPGVGEVTLQLSKTATTTRTAAATALSLDVAVDPLKLNVAKVTGSVVLAEATCETPKAPAAAARSVESIPSANAKTDDTRR